MSPRVNLRTTYVRLPLSNRKTDLCLYLGTINKWTRLELVQSKPSSAHAHPYSRTAIANALNKKDSTSVQ